MGIETPPTGKDIQAYIQYSLDYFGITGSPIDMEEDRSASIAVYSLPDTEICKFLLATYKQEFTVGSTANMLKLETSILPRIEGSIISAAFLKSATPPNNAITHGRAVTLRPQLNQAVILPDNFMIGAVSQFVNIVLSGRGFNIFALSNIKDAMAWLDNMKNKE